MDNEKVPEWALERARAMVPMRHHEGCCSPADIENVCGCGLFQARHSVARYIAEHEEPPVDPLLGEAKALLTDWPSEAGFEDFTLKALRRGIELARKEDDHAK